MKLRLTLAAMVAILLTAAGAGAGNPTPAPDTSTIGATPGETARHSRAGLAAIQPNCYTASPNGQSYYLPV